MLVQVPEVHHHSRVAYVQLDVNGYFNTDLRDVIFLGPAPSPESLIEHMARTFTAALADDSVGEPADFATPDDPFGS